LKMLLQLAMQDIGQLTDIERRRIGQPLPRLCLDPFEELLSPRAVTGCGVDGRLRNGTVPAQGIRGRRFAPR